MGKKTHNHASVRDERILAMADLGDGFQKAGAKAISKAESADCSWKLLHGPEFRNIALGRAPVLGHKVS